VVTFDCDKVSWPLCGMPHKHSPAARAERFDRAIQRGYINPGSGKTWIQADTNIASRAASVARSLSFHDKHNKTLQACYPVGSQATRAAKKLLRPGEFRAAMGAHSGANEAKHAWKGGPSAAVLTKVQQPFSWADAFEGEGLPDSWEEVAINDTQQVQDMEDSDQVGAQCEGGSICVQYSVQNYTFDDNDSFLKTSPRGPHEFTQGGDGCNNFAQCELQELPIAVSECKFLDEGSTFGFRTHECGTPHVDNGTAMYALLTQVLIKMHHVLSLFSHKIMCINGEKEAPKIPIRLHELIHWDSTTKVLSLSCVNGSQYSFADCGTPFVSDNVDFHVGHNVVHNLCAECGNPIFFGNDKAEQTDDAKKEDKAKEPDDKKDEKAAKDEKVDDSTKEDAKDDKAEKTDDAKKEDTAKESDDKKDEKSAKDEKADDSKKEDAKDDKAEQTDDAKKEDKAKESDDKKDEKAAKDEKADDSKKEDAKDDNAEKTDDAKKEEKAEKVDDKKDEKDDNAEKTDDVVRNASMGEFLAMARETKRRIPCHVASPSMICDGYTDFGMGQFDSKEIVPFDPSISGTLLRDDCNELAGIANMFGFSWDANDIMDDDRNIQAKLRSLDHKHGETDHGNDSLSDVERISDVDELFFKNDPSLHTQNASSSTNVDDNPYMSAAVSSLQVWWNANSKRDHYTNGCILFPFAWVRYCSDANRSIQATHASISKWCCQGSNSIRLCFVTNEMWDIECDSRIEFSCLVGMLMKVQPALQQPSNSMYDHLCYHQKMQFSEAHEILHDSRYHEYSETDHSSHAHCMHVVNRNRLD